MHSDTDGDTPLGQQFIGLLMSGHCGMSSPEGRAIGFAPSSSSEHVARRNMAPITWHTTSM